MKNQTIFFLSLLTIFFSTSCTGITQGIIINIDQDHFSNPSANKQSISKLVEVFDVRESSAMERDSLGVSIGQITLEPNEIKLIKNVIENALIQIIESKKIKPELKIYCGIKKFDISTPSTALYWDIITKLQIILRIDDNEKMIDSERVERTYIWPSNEIITRVTTSSLTDLLEETKKELPQLIENYR